MKRLAMALAVVVSPVPAIAGDEQVPPPPAVRGGWTPPPAPHAPAAIDEERLSAIVDRAVERALDRRLGTPSAPGPTGWTPPTASPQAAALAPRPVARIVPAAPARRVAYAPVYGEERQYVRVLVPAPAHRRAIAAIGERMAECGKPRTRTMRVAPSAVATCATAAARPVYAAPQSASE